MKFNPLALGAVVVLIAAIAGVYYTGFSAGRNSVNLSELRQQHADLVRFTQSQQDIYDRYELVLQEVYKEAPDKSPVPPVIARVINKLPDPVK